MKVLDEKHYYKVSGDLIISFTNLIRAIEEEQTIKTYMLCGAIVEKLAKQDFEEV